MIEIPALVASAVAALVPYLTAAGSEAAKKLGGAAAERLAGSLKRRLTSPAAQDALAEIEKAPADPDAQAALRQALKKALGEDAAFREELAALVVDLERARGGVEQRSAQMGDGNASVQIAGGGNQVVIGKPT